VIEIRCERIKSHPLACRARAEDEEMSETQHWNVHYLHNSAPQQRRTRLLSSMHDALTAACALRLRHAVQYVGGPNGEKFDSDAIEKWCEEHEVMGVELKAKGK
jgi:hypothetical protein